jgi:hypothetical protein
VKIVVNHVTRMQLGYICVAGIDVRTNTHVRPVLRLRRLPVNALSRAGGPFDVAAVVDLGTVQNIGRPPESEDHIFDPAQARAEKTLDGRAFWALLKAVSRRTLGDIFGADLHAQRRGCAVDEGRGTHSLGCLVPADPPTISVDGWGKIRADVSDGTFSVNLSVTDLRLWKKSDYSPRMKAVADVQQRIAAGVGVILGVGLARPYQVTGDTARRHWLQVNNVHLEDDPTWQVG